jgi:hypothetical protein
MSNMSVAVAGGGLAILGYSTGIVPHEASLAVASAGGAILVMRENSKRNFFVLSVASFVVAILLSGFGRKYGGWTEESALLAACLIGFATPYLLREFAHAMPKVAKAMSSGLVGWINAKFDKHK